MQEPTNYIIAKGEKPSSTPNTPRPQALVLYPLRLVHPSVQGSSQALKERSGEVFSSAVCYAFCSDAKRVQLPPASVSIPICCPTNTR